MTDLEWVPGDMLGLQIPAHSAALRTRGEDFLTEAFHATGVLAADNRVVQITHFEECLIGGTGAKLLLSVAYEKAAPHLYKDLFVKFSRNFNDANLDRNRHMLESEVRFATLSALPGFPIAVPACLFADFHHESGTGLLIMERVAFGAGRIERHYAKCLDYEMPEPLEHYKALMKALARLSGTHKAGRLSNRFDQQFPFDAHKSIAADRLRYDARQLGNRMARLAEFTAKYPHLVPKNIAAPSFLAKMANELPLLLKHEQTIKEYLLSKPEFVALGHWNANIDNAWFWRNDQGELECGLMDWARVDQFNVAQTIYGAFSGAETALWDNHFDDILAVFAAEYRSVGGPILDVQELKLHVQLTTAMMGMAYLMDGPNIIQAQIPDLAEVESRFDARFGTNEAPRTHLHMMTMFLNQWDTQDFGAALDQVLRRASVPLPG